SGQQPRCQHRARCRSGCGSFVGLHFQSSGFPESFGLKSMANNSFPRMLGVRQHFPKSAVVDFRTAIRQGFTKLQSQIKPGANIAVAVGGRGITNLQGMVALVLDLLRGAGAKPFVVPAMGSHGGATPDGQKGLLAEYGVSEAQLGVAIKAEMEVERLGA